MSEGRSTRSELAAAQQHAARTLLAARSSTGPWVGHLSSSALSTATAVTALSVVLRSDPTQHVAPPKLEELISRGRDWLIAHANPDGGWGDSILSASNLSTTTLVWAALHLSGRSATVERAEDWIRQRVGTLEPSRLARAIIARYGKDRTFSVPILTLCALAGRLGEGKTAWDHVIPLPFELAALPQSWFAALRLPVVSYALPALIAMGQARHVHAPSKNPALRWLRQLARSRTLRLLDRIQPVHGGFLEATPLTSFVVMSLAGSNQAAHPVTRRGLEFLVQSVRADGSWPIDTNLATWLTTLSINSLGANLAELSGPDRDHLRNWLLRQQYTEPHAYTGAAPGGWAWTDLPGGVPDADDTAGALLALRALGPVDDSTQRAAAAGLTWLLGLQNRDGGIPTFCRGWGALHFDRSSADITAHTMRAWLAWLPWVDTPLRLRLQRALPRALRFLLRSQRPDGTWVPLWFGNQHAPDEENQTYGTSRVLCAFADLARSNPLPPPRLENFQAHLQQATQWLIHAQNRDGGWGGSPGTESSIEETGLAVEALGALQQQSSASSADPTAAHQRGLAWLVKRVEDGSWKQPAPIGFYFARLWYYEELYPLIYTTAALSRAAGEPPTQGTA